MAFKFTDLVFHAKFPDVQLEGKHPQTIKAAMVKHIADKIAHRANKDGLCFPSYSRIAEDACCGRNTAIRGVQALEQLGVMKLIPSPRSKREGGRRSPRLSNTYIMSAEALERLNGSAEDCDGAPEDCDGAPQNQEIVLPRTVMVSGRDSNPSLNQSEFESDRGTSQPTSGELVGSVTSFEDHGGCAPIPPQKQRQHQEQNQTPAGEDEIALSIAEDYTYVFGPCPAGHPDEQTVRQARKLAAVWNGDRPDRTELRLLFIFIREHEFWNERTSNPAAVATHLGLQKDGTRTETRTPLECQCDKWWKALAKAGKVQQKLDEYYPTDDAQPAPECACINCGEMFATEDVMWDHFKGTTDVIGCFRRSIEEEPPDPRDAAEEEAMDAADDFLSEGGDDSEPMFVPWADGDAGG